MHSQQLNRSAPLVSFAFIVMYLNDKRIPCVVLRATAGQCLQNIYLHPLLWNMDQYDPNNFNTELVGRFYHEN